jgi:predicted RecA/RadA family phage recombinase
MISVLVLTMSRVWATQQAKFNLNTGRKITARIFYFLFFGETKMAKNYVQEGKNLTLIAPSGGVVSGSPYKIGALTVVALLSVAVGVEFNAATEGVFQLTKVTADAPAQGVIAYLVDGTTNISTSPTAATAIGHFVKAQINGDTTCQVRLSN